MLKTNIPRRHRLWWQSSYDRGLDILLKFWPQIKEKYPDAELWISYGWNLFDKGFANNPERQAWKERINKLMEQPGITHFGRIGKGKMKKLRAQCGIWSYCTYFAEISCIGALESQRDGLVPVTMNSFALAETVGSGSKVNGDIYDQEIQDTWLNELYKYMDDEKLWSSESAKAQRWAQDYDWDKIADLWILEF